MRFKHIAAIASLAAITASKPLAAEVTTYVNFFGRAVANAASDGFPDALKVLVIQEIDNSTVGNEPNTQFYKDGITASSPHGTAEIDINGYGQVHWFPTYFGDPKAGNLRASLNARLWASNPGIGPEGYVQSAYADLAHMKVIVDWTDQVIVEAPSTPPGTPLTVTNNFKLTGYLAPEASGDFIPLKTGGFAESWVLLQGQTNSSLPTPLYNQYYGYARSNGPNIDGLKFDPPVSIPYTYQAITGQPYDLGLSLEVGGKGLAAVGTGAVALRTPASVLSVVSADFTKTLTWGGVISVKNAITGEPIDDWTIRSESGFDYARSYIVPEPTGISLCALWLLGWMQCAARLRSSESGKASARSGRPDIGWSHRASVFTVDA